MPTAYQLKTVSSPVGKLYLVADRHHLVGCFFNDGKMKTSFQGKPFTPGENPVLRKAAAQLKEYFAGKRARFSIPFRFEGTDFQKKVWKGLTRISFGETLSYRGLARKIGEHKAARAVGNANGRNPICIIVPCHRVIAADGGMGGFTGGLDKKRKLLKLEQIAIKAE
ncbi:MAG: methylated-DNA--[protein]-cysteine S-methyltransferase [Proteobacteria bacterium]|nr:methylated-DNA--[protein]-cysteine S-methyltransferase [Pseudomonadota bacterium]